MSIPRTSHTDVVTRAGRAELTRQLFAQLVDDPPAARQADLREQIVALNLRVAHAVAARYRGRGVDQDDLEQAAAFGLVKATLHFDPARMKDFLTYAVPTIRGEVQHYFRDVCWAVRPPRRIQELQWRLNTAIDRLTVVLGRDPTQAEILDDLDITHTEYAEAIAAFGAFQPPSLDQPVNDDVLGDGGLTLGDAIITPVGDFEALERHLVLQPVLEGLAPKELRLLRRRFVDDWTQHEIATELGVGQAQVSRWLLNIFRQMRHELDNAQELLAG